MDELDWADRKRARASDAARWSWGARTTAAMSAADPFGGYTAISAA